MAKQFWVRTSKGVQGPFSGQQIKSFYEAGKLKGNHEISPDQEHWQSLGKVMSLPSNAAAATSEPPAGKNRPAGAKKKSSKVVENIEDFEEDADEIEDYDDEDEWGGMGSYGAPLPSPGTRGQKQGGGGNLQNTRVGLQVFQYSWLCLTMVVYLWINLFGVMYVTMQVGMSMFDPFDRDSMSPKAAMGIGYFVALLFLAALFGLTCLAKRGIPIYAAIIAFVCLLFGAGIFVESRDFGRTLQSVIEWCGVATKALTYTSMVAIFIGWCLCLSGPSKLRLPVVIGLISVPLIALCFWLADETGESRRNFKTAIMWLAAGANVALPICMLSTVKLCESLAEHKGNKRVPKEARSAWLQTLFAYGISLVIVGIAMLLDPIILFQHGIWFALAPPLASVFSAIVLMELLTDTGDLV